MARSQNSFNKKERQKKKLQKKKEKLQKKEERKANSTSGDLDSMMAYVDEFGNIVDTPPEENAKKSTIKAEDIEVSVSRSEPEDMEAERTGKVAFFNDAKGFGFIDEPSTRERYFVHVNNTKEAIAEGDKVKFLVEKGPKGLIAVDVERV